MSINIPAGKEKRDLYLSFHARKKGSYINSIHRAFHFLDPEENNVLGLIITDHEREYKVVCLHTYVIDEHGEGLLLDF